MAYVRRMMGKLLMCMLALALCVVSHAEDKPRGKVSLPFLKGALVSGTLDGDTMLVTGPVVFHAENGKVFIADRAKVEMDHEQVIFVGNALIIDAKKGATQRGMTPDASFMVRKSGRIFVGGAWELIEVEPGK